jgi:DNA polymerase-3 subunit delta
MKKKADLSYREARQEIEAGTLRPVYYVRGDEELLKRELADALLAAAVDARTRDFNYHVAEAGELDTGELASLLRTPPMVYGKRLVHVKDSPRMSPKAREIAVAFAKNPTPDVILLIVDPRRWQDIPPAQRNPKYLADIAAAGAALVTCWSLSERELATWVKSAFRTRGLAVSGEVASFFIEAVGEDLARLDTEVEKLATFASGEKEVNLSHIEAVTGRYREDTVYELAHLVSEGKLSGAMRVLANLRLLGEPHVRMIFWLTRHYVELGRLFFEGVEARRKAYLEARSRRPSEVLARSLRQAALHDRASVRKSLAEIYEADISIKRRGEEADGVMERLIVNLAMIAGGKAQ